MGLILAECQPERSHMDLIRTNFHDFVRNRAFPNLYICYIEIVYLLYRDRKLLAGLAGLPAWSGLGLSCLPRQQQQPAASGGRLLLLVKQARQAQARPSRQASQASQQFSVSIQQIYSLYIAYLQV